jgi:hypothetical protein
MPAIVFGLDCPETVGERAFEAGAEKLEGSCTQRRAVDRRDHGCIIAASEEFAQADLKGTELTAPGIWIVREVSAVCINEGREPGGVIAYDNDDDTRVRLEREDSCGEER